MTEQLKKDIERFLYCMEHQPCKSDGCKYGQQCLDELACCEISFRDRVLDHLRKEISE